MKREAERYLCFVCVASDFSLGSVRTVWLCCGCNVGFLKRKGDCETVRDGRMGGTGQGIDRVVIYTYPVPMERDRCFLYEDTTAGERTGRFWE